jgi:anti-anti-sigma factor
VQTHADKPIDDLVNFIKREVVRFHGSEIFEDDLTMIAVKVEQVLKINDRPSGKYKYASDYSQLYAVRDLVEKECHNCPGDHEKMSQDLKLAINEIFCNIVKHGYKQKIGGSIVIQFEHDHDGLKVEISDQGAVFDPLKLTEPNLFGDKEDGFGWYIVWQLVDEVMYLPKQNDGGWNHLRLYKRYFMGEESMEIDHTVKNHVLIITPLGTNLDAKESSDFKERVLRLINDNKSHHVIVDLNQVTFIDSSGLGSFLSILRRLNSEGGDLKLSSMTKAVRSMFELVSMHKIFEIFNSTDDALHAIEVTSR